MDLVLQTARSRSSVRLVLHSAIDTASRGVLHDAVIAVLTDDDVTVIVLDLADVTFIDSAGMSTVVACHRAVAVSGRSMRIEHVAPSVRRQFYTAGLLGLLGIANGQPAEVGRG